MIDHPLYKPIVGETLYRVYFEWLAADCPLDNPQWPKSISEFLGEMVEDRIGGIAIEKYPEQWKAWLAGSFVGFLAREEGFERALELAEEFCREVPS